MVTSAAQINDINERFSAVMESIQFGVEEENLDATLAQDLIDELVELRAIVLENLT